MEWLSTESTKRTRKLVRRQLISFHCLCIVMMTIGFQYCVVVNAFLLQSSVLQQRKRFLSTSLFNTAGKDTDRHNTAIPKHVAFICDGNSRWAESRSLPAVVGHAAGADRLVECLSSLEKAGVQYCTMYGFSTENWSRSPREISDILTIIERTAIKFQDKAIQENVRVKILGNVSDQRLPTSLRTALRSLEQKTYEATADLDSDKLLTVCLAINYGGRQDILHASMKLAEAIAEGSLDPANISEAAFKTLLYTAEIPDPDLVVRTGGEQRLSNFLLWDMAYAELYFTDTLWPDFDDLELNGALAWFASRSRRFGARVSVPCQ